MKFIETDILGVLIIEPKVFGDNRGFFVETYQKEHFRAAGIDVDFVQDNQSRSTQGVLRGLHYQTRRPQGKLVRCTRGEVFDVAVDIRENSPTFGKWVGVMLSEENHRQLYIPSGLAHGFCTLSEIADFEYKCTDFYDPGHEAGIRWDDPLFAIDWPIVDPQLSERDKEWPLFTSVEKR